MLNPLVVAICILPTYGAFLLLVHLTSLRFSWGMALVTRHSALVYTTVLCGALILLLVTGLPRQAFIRDDVRPAGILIGLLAVVPFAVLPYFGELWLSTRLALPRIPQEASLITGADASVDALAVRRERFGAVAAITAVAEEILFRGAVLAFLLDARSVLAAVAVSSLVFGLHHIAFGAPAVAGKAVAGALWATSMIATGLLIFPLLCHLLFQLLVYRRLVRTRS